MLAGVTVLVRFAVLLRGTPCSAATLFFLQYVVLFPFLLNFGSPSCEFVRGM